MLMQRFAFGFIFVFFVSATVFAQGEFLRIGESGFGAQGIKPLIEDSDAFGTSVGYCIMGKYDISLSYSSNDDGTVSSFSPAFTYYMKETKTNQMTGVGATAGVGVQDSGRRSTTYALLGLTAFANYFLNNNIAVQASASGTALIALGDSDDRVTAGVTPALTFILARNSPFRMFGGIGYTLTDTTDDDNYFSVAAGFVVAWQ